MTAPDHATDTGPAPSANPALSAADAMALRPAGGYGLILADPPWAWAARSDKGMGRSPEAHYRTMSDAEIAGMAVGALAAPDCLLWLWTTWPKLPTAMVVLKSWGFDYRTGAVWHKTTVTGKTAFGTGYIMRSASEPVLLGVRGAPRLGSRSERNVIMAPTREHSRKPDETYELLERLCPGAQRLELFARARRPGWDAWGNEVGKFGGEAAA